MGSGSSDHQDGERRAPVLSFSVAHPERTHEEEAFISGAPGKRRTWLVLTAPQGLQRDPQAFAEGMHHHSFPKPCPPALLSVYPGPCFGTNP